MPRNYITEFGCPFEIWREEGLVRLVLSQGATIQVSEMKELLRLLDALDPGRTTPVLLEQDELAGISHEAGTFVLRACKGPGRCVAFMAHGLADRLQGNFFLRFQRPRFLFRVFGERAEAMRWLRERHQLMTLGVAVDRG